MRELRYFLKKMNIDIQSNAKLNLGLQIEGKRDDGYHNISTLMQEINLYDEIQLNHNNLNSINLSLRGIPTPNNSSNLCYIAAKSFLETYQIKSGINITLNKKIPIGAGLGGGSSNAASIVRGLGELFSIDIDNKSMELILSKIGADIPFFINGGLQLAEGIGQDLEVIQPLLKDFFFLLICPDISISTQWAYKQYRKYLEISTIKTKFHPLSDKIEWSLLENDFEKVVLSTYPEIKKIKSELQRSESLFSSLSGSGSTMFGVYDNLESIRKASDLFNEYQTYETLPVY